MGQMGIFCFVLLTLLGLSGLSRSKKKNALLTALVGFDRTIHANFVVGTERIECTAMEMSLSHYHLYCFVIVCATEMVVGVVVTVTY